MKKGTKKSPIQHIPKTKEQLELEMKIEAKRKLIKEDFYPALVACGYSVEETGMLLGAISSLIMAEAMEALHVMKIDDVGQKMAKKLTQEQEGQGLLNMEALMDVFKGKSLFETRGHIEAMKQVIEQMKTEAFQEKKLNEMNPLWDKYLR